MAESADAYALGAYGAIREGSSPSPSRYVRSVKMSVDGKQNITTKQISKEGCTVVLEVTADAALVNECFHNATLQVQSRAQLQGFRAGKVPLDLVKKNFSGHILERALDTVIRRASLYALQETKLNAVMAPTVSKADFTSLKENTPFTFEMSVDVAPEFEPKDYIGIKVAKNEKTVSKEDIKNHINAVLENNATLEAAKEGEAVNDENYVIVSYTGKKNGVEDKKYTAKSEMVDMSAPQTIAGLADNLKGMKKGETKTFETKEEETPVEITVTVEEIKNKVLPTLDDKFAKDMGFENLEKLEEHVKNALEHEAKHRAEKEVINQIEDALVKANNFDLPKALVDYHTNLSVENFIQRMFGGKTANIPEENRKTFVQKMRPSVEKDLRIGYIIHAIANKENIAATDADLKEEMDNALKNSPKEAEQIKRFFETRKEDILATIKERKVFTFLKEKANIA